ncbi:hypothetical protein ACFL54_08065 [Planctomycetota bacterium]
MKQKILFLGLAVLLGYVMVAAGEGNGNSQQDQAPPEMQVKYGTTPTIDGTIEKREWDGAQKIKMEDGRTILVKHDADCFYVGFIGKGHGIGSIFVLSDDKVNVLHASFSLGTAVYQKEKDNDTWKNIIPFKWDRDADKCWKNMGWKANMIPTGDKCHMEFAVSFKVLGIKTEDIDIRDKESIPAPTVVLAYFPVTKEGRVREGKTLTWPKDIDDGSVNERLMMGSSVKELKFNPDKWGRLRSETCWLNPEEEKD